MEEQSNSKYPQIYEKYKEFSLSALKLLKLSGKKGATPSIKSKSKVIFGDKGNISVEYEYEPSFSILLSSHDEEIKKLPEFLNCESELKKHPNYKNAYGLTLPIFLAELVNKTKSLDFDQAIFDRVYMDFENFLNTLVTRYKTHALLNSFSMEEDYIELESGIIIKKMQEKELAETIDSISSHTPLWQVLSCRYRLEIDYKVKEGLENRSTNPRVEAINTIKKIVAALRLFKNGDVYNELYYDMPVSWCLFAKGITSSSSPLSPMRAKIEPELRLEKGEGEELKKFWILYKEFATKQSQFMFLETAMSRFDFAYDNLRIEDRLIDYMIAFEALFLKGDEEQELSYRLGLRAAVLLENPGEPRKEIFQNMRIAYSLRSLVVHGKNYDKIKIKLEEKYKTIDIFILLIEKYLRASIKKFMDLIKTYPNQKEIIKELDSKILS